MKEEGRGSRGKKRVTRDHPLFLFIRDWFFLLVQRAHEHQWFGAFL